VPSSVSTLGQTKNLLRRRYGSSPRELKFASRGSQITRYDLKTLKASNRICMKSAKRQRALVEVARHIGAIVDNCHQCN